MKPRSLNTTRKGYWQVIDDQGELIDRHSEYAQADETADNWAFAHPGREVEVLGPRYVTVYKPGSAPAPEQPAEPQPSPPPPEPDDPPSNTDRPTEIPVQQIQDLLNAGGVVDIPRGSILYGTLRVVKNNTRIISTGEGSRPIIQAAASEHGIDIAIDAGIVLIEGLDIRGDKESKSKSNGINANIHQNTTGTLTVVVRNCEISYFDTLIHAVDSKQRQDQKGLPDSEQVFGQPGRISLLAEDCILHNAQGSDTHSIGVYIEGNDVDTMVRRCVFAYINTDDPRTEAHGVYVQLFGAPVTVEDCVFYRCVANGAQLRTGGYVHRNVIIKCGMGLSLQRWNPKSDSKVTHNVVLYPVDISPDQPRRDAFNLESPHLIVEYNLALLPLGTANRYAFESYWNPKSFKKNVVVGWPQDRAYRRSITDNLWIAEAPGLPPAEAAEAFVRLWLKRGPDQDVPGAHEFIDLCQGPVREAAK